MKEALDKLSSSNSEESVVLGIIKQVQEPIAEVLNDLIKGIKYEPVPADMIDLKDSGVWEPLASALLKEKIGDSIEATLIGLQYTKDGNKDEADTSKLIDKLISIEAIKDKTKSLDLLILDIVDAFTSEDQDAYKEYSYKEDNKTKLSWEAKMNPANFTASINGNTISILSGGNDEYTGKLVQDGKDIALDANHSANFAYDKEFTIELERKIDGEYTQKFTSNKVLINNSGVEPEPNPEPNPNPQPEPNPEPNPGNDNTIIIPPYEPDNRDEHSYRPRRPRAEKKEDNKEETKTIETNTKPIEKTKLSPIEVADKVLPVNFTDIVNERRRDAIINLASRGVLAGMSKDKFMPNTTVTRAMVAAVFMRISRDKFINTSMSAKDIMMKDWYFNSVKWAMTHGIVAGYPDGSFKPMKKVSRQELAVMLEGLLKLYNINMPNIVDVDYSTYSYLPAWSRDAVIDVVRKGLLEVDQDGKFGYYKEVSRADFAYAIDKIVEFALNN